MKKIKTFFSKLDIYGTKFHFHMLHELKFNTFIGGIITLFLSIFSFIFLFIFGSDFFFRKNPNSTYSTVGERYSKINLKKEKFNFAFRFEDEYGFPTEISNITFLKIYYYYSIPDKNNIIRNEYKEEYIPYRLCKDSDFESSENLIKLYGNLYCIEWENLTFGGYWDNEFIYYFEVRLYYCENGENYSFNESKCATIKQLDHFYNHQNIYFSVYYTTIDFRVNDLKHPLNRKHMNYFTYISHNFRKTDRLFIQEQILNDDQGWIISSHKNISIWGGQSINSDYRYYNDETINEEGFNSMFYSITLYMTNSKIYYTRKYMKVPDVFALIGGLLTCINIIGKVINRKINLSMKKRKILRKIFDGEEFNIIYSTNIDNKNINFKHIKFNNMKSSFINLDFDISNINNDNSISRLYSMNNSFLNNSTKFDNSKKMMNTNFISLYNKNLHSFQMNNNNNIKITLNNSNENPKKKIMTQIKDNKKKYPKLNTKITKKKDNIMKKNKEVIKYMIKKMVIEDLKRYFCCVVKKNKKYNFYDKMNYIYNEQIDIFHYFHTLKEVNFLKQLFLSQYQNLAIEFTKTINLKNFDVEMYTNQNKIKEVVNYFKYIFKHKINSNLDNFIYNKLQDEIKCLI